MAEANAGETKDAAAATRQAAAPRATAPRGAAPRETVPAGGPARTPAAAAARAGLDGIIALTGKQAESVTAVEPAGEGWLIAVEVIEDQRVPSSADILATYEAELDGDGTLLAYRRTRRYARGRGDGGGRMRR